MVVRPEALRSARRGAAAWASTVEMARRNRVRGMVAALRQRRKPLRSRATNTAKSGHLWSSYALRGGGQWDRGTEARLELEEARAGDSRNGKALDEREGAQPGASPGTASEVPLRGRDAEATAIGSVRRCCTFASAEGSHGHRVRHGVAEVRLADRSRCTSDADEWAARGHSRNTGGNESESDVGLEVDAQYRCCRSRSVQQTNRRFAAPDGVECSRERGATRCCARLALAARAAVAPSRRLVAPPRRLAPSPPRALAALHLAARRLAPSPRPRDCRGGRRGSCDEDRDCMWSGKPRAMMMTSSVFRDEKSPKSRKSEPCFHSMISTLCQKSWDP